LVAEYVMISAPKGAARCTTGEAKALSTTKVIPDALAICPTAATSTSERVGFAGVSQKNTRVDGVIAASHAFRSVPSTSV
jgi:hypothetical protein